MQTEQFGLLGHPLGHSMSPFIHQKLFALSGREAPYALYDTPPEELKEKMPLLLAGKGFNVTIPYKVEILPFLDEIDARAARYQSVNTVVCEGGKHIGYNTDVDGFLRGIARLGTSLSDGDTLLLGSGGVANMIATETALAGSRLTIAVRPDDVEQAASLKRRVLQICPEAQVRTCLLSEAQGSCNLLINATPVGMYPREDGCAVIEEVISRAAHVFDVVYNPFETKLIHTAKTHGIPAGGGLTMLVWQAAVAQKLWLGADFTEDEIDAVIAAARGYMETHFRG